jgi:predicted nucleic acid-binding protein
MGAKMGLITEGSKVFDTNILIYHLNDCLENSVEKLLEKAFESNSYVSVVTRIELLGWAKHTDESLNSAQELLNILNEQPLSEEVVTLCIQLRQTTSLKMPDAIIAATALHLKLPLITRNIKDFQKVPHLQLFNPFEPSK